jgi:hypothetical protein
MARAEPRELPQSANGTRKLSQVAMAKAVLAASHREMHVKEISQGIKAMLGVEIKPSYLAPIMYRQKGVAFYKSDKQPNTYGLSPERTAISASFRAESIDSGGVLVTEGETYRTS